MITTDNTLLVKLGSLTTISSTCHILSHLWRRTILASLIYSLRHIGEIEVVTTVRRLSLSIGLAIIVISASCICISVLTSMLEAVGVVTASLTSSMTMLWRRSLLLLAIRTLILKYSINPLNEIGSFRYRRPSACTRLWRLLRRRISVWNCFKLLPCLLRTVHSLDISLVVGVLIIWQ